MCMCVGTISIGGAASLQLTARKKREASCIHVERSRAKRTVRELREFDCMLGCKTLCTLFLSNEITALRGVTTEKHC